MRSTALVLVAIVFCRAKHRDRVLAQIPSDRDRAAHRFHINRFLRAVLHEMKHGRDSQRRAGEPRAPFAQARERAAICQLRLDFTFPGEKGPFRRRG